jgi:hypothetical protein
MLRRDLHPSPGASSPGGSGNKFGAILPPGVPGCKPLCLLLRSLLEHVSCANPIDPPSLRRIP